MKKIAILSIIFLVLLLTGCKEKVLEPRPEGTGPETSCTTDDDCWCFIEGKIPSRCCTEEFQKDHGDRCPVINKCIQCLYK